MKIELSVIILTKNEENNIIDCIDSVLFAEEIIVLDDYSSDRTVEIIKNFNNKKIKIYTRKLDDFSTQRNYGASKASGKWLLFIDADEIVSRELKIEILNSIKNNFFTGFFIRRIDSLWGTNLKHGEISSVKLLRLFKNGYGNWEGRVHETLILSGNSKILKSFLLHRPHSTIAEFINEINNYTEIRAKELHEKGVSVGLWSIIAYPVGKFLVNYILRSGFLDGISGFIFAVIMSYHSFLVRGKLFLLNKKRRASNFK